MEEILSKSQENHNQLSSRVTALLAGSSLTTTAGVRIERRDTIEQVDYTAVGESYFKLSNLTKSSNMFETGDDLSKLKERYKPRRRKAQSEIRGPVSIHQANSEELEYRAAAAGIKVQRRSIKRMSLARLRKTSEFSGLRPYGSNEAQEEAAENADLNGYEDHRRIVGLKRSKVPMMVYSHGGFSRCFRIARRYQVEGPPIGVEYEEETRNALNPELQNA